jgi:DNA-binding transcriptional MerR regulator
MGNHQDKAWLKKEYVEKKRRPSDIADECGVSQDTIHYFRRKFDLPKVPQSEYRPKNPQKYHDKEWLRKEYVEKRNSIVEIGEKCGVAGETIRRWLEKSGIERRNRSEATAVEWEDNAERRKSQSEWLSEKRRTIHASIFTRDTGYVCAGCGVCGDQVRMHRLLAVAKYGFEAVEEKDVHHKNEIKWDNRPDNVELLSRSEHMQHHENWENSPSPP